jgi:TolA-binding protein
VKWPDDANAEGALYWSGESYLSKGEMVEASDAFESVIARFPHGTRTPDSLLELGVANARLGNRTKASTYFARLTSEFPRSEAARRVPKDFAAPKVSSQ